jgi:hypothetical protein
LADGPRPWTIRLFALILLGAGLWNFVPQLIAALAEPGRGYRIALVSALSAQFSIVAIPVAAIWLLASNVARWLITVVSAVSAIRLVAMMEPPEFAAADGVVLATGLATHSVCLLLFTPSARQWFARRNTRDADAFA